MRQGNIAERLCGICHEGEDAEEATKHIHVYIYIYIYIKYIYIYIYIYIYNIYIYIAYTLTVPYLYRYPFTAKAYAMQKRTYQTPDTKALQLEPYTSESLKPPAK